MAQAMLKDSRLTLVFETGMSEDGKPIHKTKSYANVQKDATPDQLSQAADALGSLSAYPLISVERTDKHNII